MSSEVSEILSCLLLFLCLRVSTKRAAERTWKQNREIMPAVTAGQSDDSKQDAFHVLDGYQVEKLFDVPRDDLGSWVSLTTDPQGRLYAYDQQEKGLVRITPAALDGSTETVVEKVPAELSVHKACFGHSIVSTPSAMVVVFMACSDSPTQTVIVCPIRLKSCMT